MAGIPFPTATTAVGRDRVNLTFSNPAWTGEYYLAGGICWPQVTDSTNSPRGVAIVCGVRRGHVFVFAEHEFMAIKQVGEHPGLEVWLRDMTLLPGVAKFYHRDPKDTHRQYSVPLFADARLAAVYFPKVSWADEYQPLQSVWELVASGNLNYSRGGLVYNDLQRYNVHNQGPLPPGVHALLCVVTGLTRFPPR